MSGDHRRRPQGREFNAVEFDAEEGIPIRLAAPAEAVSPEEQGHCFMIVDFPQLLVPTMTVCCRNWMKASLIPRKFLIFRVAILMAYIS